MSDQLTALNVALREAGLPEHAEPAQLPSDDRWSADMYGYSGLHYLRRIAAHLAFGRSLPAPGDDDAADDALLKSYFDDVDAPEPSRGFWARLRGRPRPAREFDHLMVHSDAEGFYVPIDFAAVLFPRSELEIVGGMVGSSSGLLRECERLAHALGIPPEVAADDDELWEAADAQGEGDGWRRYGVEAFTCVRLREGARRSLAAKSVLMFT